MEQIFKDILNGKTIAGRVKQELTGYRTLVETEQQEFQILFSEKLAELTGEE